MLKNVLKHRGGVCSNPCIVDSCLVFGGLGNKGPLGLRIEIIGSLYLAKVVGRVTWPRVFQRALSLFRCFCVLLDLIQPTVTVYQSLLQSSNVLALLVRHQLQVAQLVS